MLQPHQCMVCVRCDLLAAAAAAAAAALLPPFFPCFILPQVLNSRAVAVMQRMSDKLMGRDGLADGVAAGVVESDSVPAQVGLICMHACADWSAKHYKWQL